MAQGRVESQPLADGGIEVGEPIEVLVVEAAAAEDLSQLGAEPAPRLGVGPSWTT